MTDYDHYEEAITIIKMLRLTSLNNYSDSLQNAMDEGSTGTEIFMALRWNLKNLLNEDNLNDMVKIKAARLWKEIDKMLQ